MITCFTHLYISFIENFYYLTSYILIKRFKKLLASKKATKKPNMQKNNQILTSEKPLKNL